MKKKLQLRLKPEVNSDYSCAHPGSAPPSGVEEPSEYKTLQSDDAVSSERRGGCIMSVTLQSSLSRTNHLF